MTRPTALVTGATGLFGANLVREWLPRWQITAVARQHRITHPDVSNACVDVNSPDAAELVERVRPDVVVHAAAWTDLDGCERDPAEARRVHVDASRALAKAANRAGSRFVYISTDAMFSGPGRHREDDPTDARSVYARTKLDGEQASLEACPDALVLRTVIVGWNAQPKLSLVEWMLRELRAGKQVLGFEDVCFTPVLCNDLALVVERLLERKATGVLHAGGAECISKLDFAVRVAEIFDLPGELVRRAAIARATLLAPRPRHPCLDSSRCAGILGAPMRDVDATLRAMRELERSGWVDELRRFVA